MSAGSLIQLEQTWEVSIRLNHVILLILLTFWHIHTHHTKAFHFLSGEWERNWYLSRKLHARNTGMTQLPHWKVLIYCPLQQQLTFLNNRSLNWWDSWQRTHSDAGTHTHTPLTPDVGTACHCGEAASWTSHWHPAVIKTACLFEFSNSVHFLRGSPRRSHWSHIRGVSQPGPMTWQ